MVKWDIVDNVVDLRASGSAENRARLPLKSARKALATTVFFGTLLVPVFALSHVVTFSQEDVQVLRPSRADVIVMSSGFRRPVGDRKDDSVSAIDAKVGMSTRRLAEKYRSLFVPADAEDAELTGEYSFL